MNVSLVTTIFNEEESIQAFLASIFRQNKLPDEVIIVDGGSTDATNQKIQVFLKQKDRKLPVKVVKKKGNRSVGRNEGIRKAKGEIILLTDAGCLLERNWVREIQKPFNKRSVDVVAGYYEGKPDTLFQKCMIPYTLVMPDKVNANTFLPATRSMAIRKSVWKEAGGFPEEFSHNEDYVFANALQKMGKNIVFAKDAIVYWIPRKTFKEAFIMFFRFALGDLEAGIVRPKVIFLFARYLVALGLLVLIVITRSPLLILIFLELLLIYFVWSIKKNYKYVDEFLAILLLPALQLTADAAVLSGSLAGLLKRHGILKTNH